MCSSNTTIKNHFLNQIFFRYLRCTSLNIFLYFQNKTEKCTRLLERFSVIWLVAKSTHNRALRCQTFHQNLVYEHFYGKFLRRWKVGKSNIAFFPWMSLLDPLITKVSPIFGQISLKGHLSE